MSNRTIPLGVYNIDGSRYTSETPPTATVQYGASAPESVVLVKTGDAWAVTLDDTQDALVMWSGTGIVSDHLTVLKYPPQLAVIQSKTDNLPADPADQSVLEGLIAALPTAAQVEALNDLSMVDVATVLSEYEVATVEDIPTDYATEETASNILKWNTNRRVVTDTEQVLYDDDNVTPLYTQVLTGGDTFVERGKGV